MVDEATWDYVDIVFDGPPSHESGRFVEVEDPSGKGVRIGEWIDRGDGLWALRIPQAEPVPEDVEPVSVIYQNVTLLAKKSLHLRAMRYLAEDILDHYGQSRSDERINPELRDLVRLSNLQRPRTKAGREALSRATHSF